MQMSLMTRLVRLDMARGALAALGVVMKKI
jgi:hypothetical protein